MAGSWALEGSTLVEVQLWITNRTGKDLFFPTDKKFRVVIRHATGEGVLGAWTGESMLDSDPVLIRAGDTYCLTRRAYFTVHPHGGRNFCYVDPAGGTYTWGPAYDSSGMRRETDEDREPLVAGKYMLGFYISARHGDEMMRSMLERRGYKGEVPEFWRGWGRTGEVPFTIAGSDFGQ